MGRAGGTRLNRSGWTCVCVCVDDLCVCVDVWAKLARDIEPDAVGREFEPRLSAGRRMAAP